MNLEFNGISPNNADLSRVLNLNKLHRDNTEVTQTNFFTQEPDSLVGKIFQPIEFLPITKFDHLLENIKHINLDMLTKAPDERKGVDKLNIEFGDV